MLRVAAFLPRSETNGPGPRAVVWVQGCALSPPCPGCINPDFLDPARPATAVEPEVLCERLLALDGIVGVTFSGGEPFLQAEDLAPVARRVRREGLTVAVFSGYPLPVLRASERRGVAALLAQTDLLVAGPYRADLPASGPLLGSANQRLHFLTGRIAEADLAQVSAGAYEVVLDADGSLTVTGFPDTETLGMLRSHEG